MTEDQKEIVLAGCLEEFHTRRARGEIPDMAVFQERLGEWYDEFNELILAETLIDEALAPPSQGPLPMAFGSYTLLHEIGRGAAGVVYEAMHRKLGRKVALKVLRTGIDTDDTARKRFEREAQALAQVRHDHIVEIYEFGDVAGEPFYAMELVEGPTLSDMVKRDQLPEPRELCAGLAGITDALHTLHENGIVHRDVKPSNVMVRRDGRYVLADFGLARTALAQTMTKTGDALGTPLYMSPEQMLGNRDAVDRRTDVYGAGATLYQLLTGRPPFKTDNLHALMRMILTQRPEPPRAINPELPPGCSSIAAKCLEKEPGDRYQSADEMGRDLRAFAAGERVSGKPLNRFQRGVRWVQHHRAVSAAALVLVALGVWYAARPPEQASLSLRLYPRTAVAEVQIDGGSWMAMPIAEHALAPDVAHEVRVRPKTGGFHAWEQTYNLAPQDRLMDIAELRYDPEDPEAIAAFRELVEIAKIDGVRAPATHRGSYEPTLEIGLPRGTVRRADLTEWKVYVGMDFPDEFTDGGYVEFRVDGEVVDEPIPFPANPPKIDTVGAIPDEVVKALKPGDVVTWGFRSKNGEKFVQAASLLINDVSLEDKLHRIDKRLTISDEKARKIMRVTLRATLLLNHDLAYAAYREIEAALAEGIESLYILSLQQQALEKMYPKRARLLESTPYGKFLDRWGAQDDDKVEAFLKAAQSR